MSEKALPPSSSNCACPRDPYCLGMCEYTGCINDPTPLDFTLPLPSDSSSPDPPLNSATDSSHSPISADPPLNCTDPPLISADPPSTSTASASRGYDRPSQTKRFKQATVEELSQLSKGFTPQNTDRSTRWALTNFQDWANERKINPESILLSTDPNVLIKHLARFIVETRKTNGQSFPPSTLHQLLCGLLHYMRQKNPHVPNFLDKSDTHFKPLHSTMDCYFNKLHASGVGRQIQHAETISGEEEDKLWTSKVLDIATPRGLLNAVFYTIGKSFCLRGGQEHRSLKISQLKRMEDHYVYYENVSKNCNGSFRKLHVKSKVALLYSVPEAGERCPVKILDKYISRLPLLDKYISRHSS